MILILDESEDVQENLVTTILSALGRKKNVILLILLDSSFQLWNIFYILFNKCL